MITYHECFPCFLNQAIRAGHLLKIDPDILWQILRDVSHHLATMDVTAPPPKNAVRLYEIVAHLTGESDPYRSIKKRGTQEALELYPQSKELIQHHKDPLFAALRIAVGGNVMDYGVASSFDLYGELEEILTAHFVRWEYDLFRDRLEAADWVLYIGDNAGEAVFDRLLIEALERPVRFAVRGGPIINDVTEKDAREAGIDGVAEIVSTGLKMPGIDLSNCAKEFRALYEEAPLIISKGQGNFETLTPPDREIFFLFKVKCQVVSRFLGLPLGGLFMGTY